MHKKECNNEEQEQINKLEDFNLFIDIFSKNYSTSEKLKNQAFNKVE